MIAIAQAEHAIIAQPYEFVVEHCWRIRRGVMCQVLQEYEQTRTDEQGNSQRCEAAVQARIRVTRRRGVLHLELVE